jgi:broad specificity phosphatase PhoE
MSSEKQKTVIHFVRHGEIENPRGLRYGRLPGFHLSPEGRKAVEQTSLFFISRPITHIYSSPLERTQQTATLLGLAFPRAPITLDARIIEVKTPAKFEGKSRDLGFYYPSSPNAQAEVPQQIAQRMLSFVEEKVIRHNGQEIIVVSHGDPMAILYHSLLYHVETTHRSLYPNYSAVISFIYEGLTLKSAWYRS